MRISDWSSDVCSSDLSPVGEAGGGVDHHRCRVDGRDEAAYGSLVLAHDRVGVLAAVLADVTDRGLDVGDHRGGDVEGEELLRPVLLRGGKESRQSVV